MCSKPYYITAIYATITFFWFPLLLLPPFVLLLLPPFLFMVLRLLFLLLLARKRLQHHHLQQKNKTKTPSTQNNNSNEVKSHSWRAWVPVLSCAASSSPGNSICSWWRNYSWYFEPRGKCTFGLGCEGERTTFSQWMISVYGDIL